MERDTKYPGSAQPSTRTCKLGVTLGGGNGSYCKPGVSLPGDDNLDYLGEDRCLIGSKAGSCAYAPSSLADGGKGL